MCTRILWLGLGLLLTIDAHAGPPEWLETAAVAMGTPEDSGERARALRAQLVAAGESDARRARVRAAEPVLDAFSTGDPVSAADRIEVLNVTLLLGAEAGLEALREAQVRAASNPEVIAANAWVGTLIEMLVSSRTSAEAREHIARARTALGDTPGAAERLAGADMVLRALPGRPDPRLTPLLERALSRSAAEREEVVRLMSSFEGQLELVRLGVRTPAAVVADYELAVVDAYWYSCRVDDQLPDWSLVDEGDVAGAKSKEEEKKRAREVVRHTCKAEFEESWTFLLGGERMVEANALSRTYIGGLSCAPRAMTIYVGTDDEGPEGQIVGGIVLGLIGAPVVLAAAAGPRKTTVEMASRPPDCMTREEAIERAGRANDTLRRRVEAARPGG